MGNIEIFEQIEEHNEAPEDEHDTDEWWEKKNQLEDSLNPELFSQDDLVRFLDVARRSSWDIPSALMFVCGHLDGDEYFWMHRPHLRKGADPYDESKWDDLSKWEPADKHFLEVHGWNLKDERIDWSFDT